MIYNGIVIVFLMLITWFKNHKDVHILQQNGYYMDQYFNWFKSHKSKLFRPYELILVLGVFLGAHSSYWPLQITGLLLMLLHAYFNRIIFKAYPAKKPLVYTPRVKRILFTNGLLFLIIGSFSLIYLQSVLGLSLIVFYLLSPLWIALSNTLNIPLEKTINQRYINEAKALLKANEDLLVIGITGSYGKTSTKNVLNAMLSKDFNVLMTPESFNTPMGVTRAIRSSLKPIHQIFIAEMGAKKTGDIKELCELVNPSLGIITSIGPQHLDTFKTFENIISTKGELYKHLKPGGTAFVNISDPNVLGQPKRDDLNYVYFTADPLEEAPQAITPDYAIEAISVDAQGSSFTLIHIPTGKKVRLKTKLLGRHNLSNVVAGAAIALSLGVSMDRLNTLIADLSPVKHRLSIRRVDDKYTILDDAFNSNPVGSKMALEVLKNFKGNKKIIITPGMIELGDQFHALNKAFGVHISQACDYVILVGKKQTQPICEGLKEKHYDDKKIYIASSIRDAFEHLYQIVGQDDVVLIENDLPDTFNE